MYTSIPEFGCKDSCGDVFQDSAGLKGSTPYKFKICKESRNALPVKKGGLFRSNLACVKCKLQNIKGING